MRTDGEIRREKMEEERMKGREAGFLAGGAEGRVEGRMEGRVEGRIELARRTATALLALGKRTLSQIAEATQLSQEEVERLEGTTGHKEQIWCRPC